jgi:hypothetical protein
MNDLIKAAKALIERWETPLWKDAPATAGLIHALRDAVEAAERPEPARRVAWRGIGEGGVPVTDWIDGDGIEEGPMPPALWIEFAYSRPADIVSTAQQAKASEPVDWVPGDEDAEERRQFEQMLDLYGYDTRLAIGNALKSFALARDGGSFAEQCRIMANEVAKLYTRPQAVTVPPFIAQLYRWLARAQFARPSDEEIADKFDRQLRGMINSEPGCDVDSLAQFIRSINGRNLLGAASLAEKIIEWQTTCRS